MPINDLRLAHITIDVLAEHPNTPVILTFALDTDDAELERITAAIGAQATVEGMLIRTTIQHHPDAHHLTIIRGDQDGNAEIVRRDSATASS